MRSRLRFGVFHLLGSIIAAVFVLPLFWTFIASLRETGLPPPVSVEWWPQAAQWNNYAEIFQVIPLSRYLWNSLVVVAAATPLTLMTASLAGFAITQLPNSWRRGIFVISILLMMIPGMAVWLFRFHLLRWMGLQDSLWALILPAFAASNPLFVLLFYWTFWRVPASIFESARLDGASAGLIWRKIALPLARPTTAAVTLLTVIMYWNDFANPVVYIYRPELYTLPVGLQILNQMHASNWPLLMAASVVMTLPIVLLFLFLQRFFLHNLSLGNILPE